MFEWVKSLCAKINSGKYVPKLGEDEMGLPALNLEKLEVRPFVKKIGEAIEQERFKKDWSALGEEIIIFDNLKCKLCFKNLYSDNDVKIHLTKIEVEYINILWGTVEAKKKAKDQALAKEQEAAAIKAIEEAELIDVKNGN